MSHTNRRSLLPPWWHMQHKQYSSVLRDQQCPTKLHTADGRHKSVLRDKDSGLPSVPKAAFASCASTTEKSILQ